MALVGWVYRTRPIAFLGLWRPCPDRVCKVYGISTTGPTPRPELMTAAKLLAVQVVPAGTANVECEQAGVVICHDAGDSCWVLFQWWTDACILHNVVFRADGDSPGELHPAPVGVTACVWELEVIDFERRAWTATMLQTPEPNLDAYLTAQLTVEL